MAKMYIRLMRLDDQREKEIGPFTAIAVGDGGYFVGHLSPGDRGTLAVKPSDPDTLDETGNGGPWYTSFRNWDTLDVILK